MRLFFVDDQGGSLASLAAGVASLEGADGVSEVHARCLGRPASSPLVAAALAEIGLAVAPAARAFAADELTAGDRVIAVGPAALPGSHDHWAAALPAADADPLVQRSALRLVRDKLARRLQA